MSVVGRAPFNEHLKLVREKHRMKKMVEVVAVNFLLLKL